MLTLLVYGPDFGLLDSSPFCEKALTLLKMSGLAFTTAPPQFSKAPKGKFPVLMDNGAAVADSTLIRFHLETVHGIDFDRGAPADLIASAWAFEKLCEDHLYWMLVHERWMIDENFERGPKTYFSSVPSVARPVVSALVRRGVRRSLHAQGSGRYTPAERVALARRAFDALETHLDVRPFLGGEDPCG